MSSLRKHLSLIVPTLLVLCASAAPPARAQTAPDVVGAWEWTETVTGWGTSTPATAGVTRQVEFLDDGTFRLYEDEIPVAESNFEIVAYAGTCGSVAYRCSEPEIWVVTVSLVPGAEPNEKEICVYLDGETETLNLTDTCVWDGPNYHYVRRGPIDPPVPAGGLSFGSIKARFR